VPEFGGETSLAATPKEPTPIQKAEEPAIMLKTNKIEELATEGTKTLEVLSPSAEVKVPKTQKGLAATPKRKRMVNVLDVLETIKTSSSTPGKVSKASKTQIETESKLTEAEATTSRADTEVGPSEPGGDGCKGLRRKKMREGRGRRPRPRGNGGRLHKGGN
jgi:hypothetical protein